MPRGLAGLPVWLPSTDPRLGHVYHQFTIRVTGAAFGEPVHSTPDILADHLSQRGMMTAMLFPVPLHR